MAKAPHQHRIVVIHDDLPETLAMERRLRAKVSESWRGTGTEHRLHWWNRFDGILPGEVEHVAILNALQEASIIIVLFSRALQSKAPSFINGQYAGTIQRRRLNQSISGAIFTLLPAYLERVAPSPDYFDGIRAVDLVEGIASPRESPLLVAINSTIRAHEVSAGGAQPAPVPTAVAVAQVPSSLLTEIHALHRESLLRLAMRLLSLNREDAERFTVRLLSSDAQYADVSHIKLDDVLYAVSPLNVDASINTVKAFTNSLTFWEPRLPLCEKCGHPQILRQGPAWINYTGVEGALCGQVYDDGLCNGKFNVPTQE